MARGINIPFISDVRDFLRGTSSVEDSLDDVADALDDVGTGARDASRVAERALGDIADESQDVGRDLSRNIERGTDAAADAADDLERSFRDALDLVRDDSRDAGDAVGRNLRDGAEAGSSGGSETVAEFRDEAVGNFSEVASSFSGDMTSAVDLVQGTLGGLAGSIPGGLGLALGGLAAAGGAFAASWAANAEATEERIQAMYDDMIESGDSYLSQSMIQDEMHKIIKGADDAVISQKDLDKAVRLSGMTSAEVALAFAGDQDLMASFTDKVIDKQKVFQSQLEDSDDTNDSAAKSGAAWMQTMIDQATSRGEEIKKSSDLVEESRRVLENHGYTTADDTAATRDWVEAQAEADDAVSEATTSIEENNTAIADQAQRNTENLATLAGLAGSYVDIQAKGKDAGLSTSDLTALQRAQADQFVDTAGKAGISAEAAKDLAVQLGIIPAEVITDVAVTGTDAARASIDGIAAPRTVNVSPGLDPWEWQTALDQTVFNLRAPLVKVRALFGQDNP